MNRFAMQMIEQRTSLSHCGKFRLMLTEDYDELMRDSEALRNALEVIATGAGYYGAQAREYKNIARKALGMEDIDGLSCDLGRAP